ncbi:MAG TPA: hypothetical protein ENN20_01140 [Candidatus Marinimicrobia bacterium]|nr:hypothetical protein [Candidatus Neomarinimicrobiota bacterium]
MTLKPKAIVKIALNVILLPGIILLAISCKECPTEPEEKPGKVILSTVYITTRAVYLELSLSDSAKTADIRLERDSTVILETTLRSADTLVIDDSLQAGKTYSYRGYLLEKGKIQSSGEILPVTTMDTTSHAIAYWEIDTLGYRGEVNDIWIVSENNIWVVGEFVTDSGEFNAARWDGNKWTLLQAVNTAKLYSIYYFSDNDIWVTSFGLPIHWDGSVWTLYHIQNMGIDVSAGFGIWGTSSSNMYFVGLDGSIVHYNGSSFVKMTSGTTCDLDDIYGLDNKHIWAVGSKTGEFQSVILFYDGREWTTLHDTQTENFCYSNSFWTDCPYFLFLNGGSGRYFFDMVKHEYKKYYEAGSWYGYAIDGIAYNDIFATGMGSEVLHYNGSTWYLYPEIGDRFETYGHIKCVKMTSDLVVAGGFYYTGLYGLPIIIRGYR